MASSPVAGVAWQALHYLEGFRRLGHDVVYLEDTGIWPYRSCADLTDYLRPMFDNIALSSRWAYRCPVHQRTHGASEPEVGKWVERADVLLNVTGSHVLTEELMRIPARVYLETDPALPEIEVAMGHERTIATLDAHNFYLTFGEKVGMPGCRIPTTRYQYQPTRQPIVVDWWSSEPKPQRPRVFSTITSWEQAGKDIEWNGELYRWSKHREWERFIDLPKLAPAPLELALGPHPPGVRTRLLDHGWRVIDAIDISHESGPYASYIHQSSAEFTVAKEQYTRTGSGWFSDRSATYLAAGKPVITQSTGFEDILPTGDGLFAFTTIGEIVAAMEHICSDYEGNSRAALEIARAYFDTSVVIPDLLNKIGL